MPNAQLLLDRMHQLNEDGLHQSAEYIVSALSIVPCRVLSRPSRPSHPINENISLSRQHTTPTEPHMSVYLKLSKDPPRPT